MRKSVHTFPHVSLERIQAKWIPVRRENARQNAVAREYPNAMPHPGIDMVFTYVDGSDPVHAARRAELARALSCGSGECAIRYRGVGEITSAVRSVLRAMPWIGTIHIVTDGQRPPVDRELIDSGRVRVIDHGEIVPPQYRPVFASTIIESFLHRIPGLSEIWLYDNDDFLHGGAIAPGEFCEPAPGGGLRLKLRTVPGLVRVAICAASGLSPALLPRANAYTAGIGNSARLLRRRGRLPWRNVVFARHVTQVYRTATARRLEEIFADELDAARMRHFRSTDQLSWSTLAYSAECHWCDARQRRYWPLRRESDELFIDFSRFSSPGGQAEAWERVRRSQARFMCLNNIPEAQTAAFERAMADRGLTRPGPIGM
jgi:hypothetical protein